MMVRSPRLNATLADIAKCRKADFPQNSQPAIIHIKAVARVIEIYSRAFWGELKGTCNYWARESFISDRIGPK